MPWLQAAVNRPDSSVQVKLRGNILHVLFETADVLDRDYALLRLVRSLLEPDAQQRFATEFPQIYQLYFYSRLPDQKQPAWSAPLYLNRLERHLEQLVEASGDADEMQQVAAELAIGQLDTQTSAIVLSNLSLARKGDSDAIARYLSETLSALDIGVQVKVKAIPGKARRAKQVVTASSEHHPVSIDPGIDLINRLWIFCRANYSPDPALVAPPTAQRLRDLKLTQFQDAVLTIQVDGEEAPDWRLRVDLTPPDEMLKEWARWGDLESLGRLINQALQPLAVSLSAELKDATLHLVCNALADAVQVEGGTASSPTEADIVDAIAPLLEALGPQGIQRAMLYGPSADGLNPDWIKQLSLPAADSPDLAESAESLARAGDLPAIAYCLTRRLNPDIDQQLATGGVRVQLLIKDRRLHVMVDGPTCPARSAVAPPVLQFLRQHRPAEVDGIRIYGRRSGQKRPDWTHGFDFIARKRLVPEAAPEFAASDSYLNDLIPPAAAAPLRPELTLPQVLRQVRRRLTASCRQLLLQSQLFAAADQSAELQSVSGAQTANRKIAAVWAAVGLLLVFQVDWISGQVLEQLQPAQPLSPASTDAPSAAEDTLSVFEEELAELNWGQQSSEDGLFVDAESFSGEIFSTSAINDADLISSPPQSAVSTSSLLAESPFPSFKSRQLDEKLALYEQRVAASGVPDVLIVGSSRALRGIDPAALQQALAFMGYEDVSTFNFGVNGSTAQVVDFIVRELIQPYPLPKLILWADGARAFNSGRVDITFNAIAVSEGYQALQAGELFPETADADEAAQPQWANLSEQITTQTRRRDRQLSQTLGQASATYAARDQVKHVFRAGLSAILPDLSPVLSPTLEADDDAIPDTNLMDFDGFLALSVRFNPATYYQDHARVAGNYDSDYEAFRLEGAQTAALNALIQHTQAHDTPLIFVNTPLTDEYLDPARLKAEQTFQRYMLQLAASQPGFFYRDLAQLWPERYDYFSDPSHLNRYGAYQVSNRLAQDPIIPWPATRSETN
ncbi:MAG: DUF1574 domain-containing protein [Leptolyngbya sp. SIO4C1]|nr:DUF1574 domain-containing protein [Leptolyngbya sp. SIO4C1]